MTKSIIDKLHAEIHSLEEQLKRSKNAFHNIIGKNRDGILIFDAHGKIIYANPAAVDLFGKDLGDLLGENIGIFIETNHKTEITIVSTEREPTIVEVNIADTIWEDQPVKLASLRDITEHKKTKVILEELSRHDYLTGLANRIYFEQVLEHSLTQATEAQKKVAVFFLDLDGFKNVNDTFGHQIGDKLLVYVASLLKKNVRPRDLVSRIGGDEFAIIVEPITNKTFYKKLVNRILKDIKQPIFIDGHEIYVDFSIGISIYPDQAKTLDQLIKNADIAMYCAKRSGTGKYQLYTKGQKLE